MKVIFRTNIDAYNERDCFPKHFEFAPRKGEMVEVTPSFTSYYRDRKLPFRLEVTRVTWLQSTDQPSKQVAICELWYNETDKRASDIAGGKTL